MSAITLNVNIPSLITKQLKLQECANGKKLVVSTNWLPLFGFEKDTKVVEESLGEGKGIKVRLANKEDKRTKKVYSRTYHNRKNNPLETMLDIRGQKLIDTSFPKDTVNVHIVFKYGLITITPISDKKLEAIKKFKKNNDIFSTFLACSSGIDGVCLTKKGFKIETLLEYRPDEKRDKRDFSETGALNALVNISPKYLINEDIMNLDLEKIATLTCNSLSTLFHISLQCDDFSNAKASSLKEESIAETSSTIDMAYDMLKMVERFNFPTILLENVTGFGNSMIAKMVKVRLQRLGYRVYTENFNARDLRGITNRERYYMFATLLPASFEMPLYVERNQTPIWDQFIEPKIAKGELRDISHSKSIQDGLKCGRARLIKRDSVFSPTFLKSQSRMAKDTVVIYDEIRQKFYYPNNELTAELMGIRDVDFSAVSSTIENEIIGQSVEVPLHEAILGSIKEHIQIAYASLNGKLF